jgi:AcrB/AcrD/AcrF family
MWIIKVALSRPYTFIVLALAVLILAPVVVFRTPTDIFPNIDIPVVSVAWTYTGLNPEELEGRLTYRKQHTINFRPSVTRQPAYAARQCRQGTTADFIVLGVGQNSNRKPRVVLPQRHKLLRTEQGSPPQDLRLAAVDRMQSLPLF